MIIITLLLLAQLNLNRYSSIPMQATCASTEFLTKPMVDSNSWVDDLKSFRTALLTGDRLKVKSYFIFPILDPGNDIWYVADMRFAATIKAKPTVPFKESDFDKYYSELLGIDFRRTLEKIDLAQLLKERVAKSPDIEVVKGARSTMMAKYDTAKKILTLEIISKSPDFGQFSFRYYFTIEGNRSIKFKEIAVEM